VQDEDREMIVHARATASRPSVFVQCEFSVECLVRHIYVIAACLISTAGVGCGGATDLGPPGVPVLGSWTYVGVQVSPGTASLTGSLSFGEQTGARIGGTIDFVETDSRGQQRRLAGPFAGRTVDSLEYEALDSLALRTLETIADEIAVRFAIDRLAIVHRVGEVPLGEPSIAVVAVAPHRDAAFGAARYAIDETKARAPIWKAERFADGHVWIGHQARTGPEEV